MSSSSPSSPVSEFCPVVLDDGRVMYHRWEYIDKGARVAKTIWAMNPDGTRPQEFFGLADDTTTVYMYPQPLPGDDHRLVCVGTCHFPQGGCLGAILLVDYRQGHSRARPGSRPSRTMSKAIRAIRSSIITPHVFVAAPDRARLAFPDRRMAIMCTIPSGQHGHLFTHPYPGERSRSSWSRTRSIRPIITRRLPTRMLCI